MSYLVTLHALNAIDLQFTDSKIAVFDVESNHVSTDSFSFQNSALVFLDLVDLSETLAVLLVVCAHTHNCTGQTFTWKKHLHS